MAGNIYCGAGPLPKGKQRGKGEECVKSKQYRYYGIVALTNEELNKGKINTEKEFIQMKELEASLRGMMKRFEREKASFMNKKNKENLSSDEKASLEVEKQKVKDLFEKINITKQQYADQKQIYENALQGIAPPSAPPKEKGKKGRPAKTQKPKQEQPENMNCQDIIKSLNKYMDTGNYKLLKDKKKFIGGLFTELKKYAKNPDLCPSEKAHKEVLKLYRELQLDQPKHWQRLKLTI